MRVLVEFLDREPVENVLGSCIFEPEIVVFLCDERDALLVKESAIYRLFRHRGLRTKPRFLYFNASEPRQIIEVLRAVKKDYPDCVFDFSGGKDLVLLMAGAFSVAQGIPAYYIDQDADHFITLRGVEHLSQRFTMPQFTAEDTLALAGATVGGYGHFSPEELTGAFAQDIRAVWPLVGMNPKAWGELVSLLQAWNAGAPMSALEIGGARVLQNGNGRLRCNTTLLRKLHATGVLTACRISEGEAHIRFKSKLHKKCLLNNGIWLELYCYTEAVRTGFFHDVRSSMVIDWTGVDGGADNTKNEVDVFMVRGITPLFVSCKMSAPSPLALAEIMLLARRFGGRHGRPVMLTAAHLGDKYKALRLRAQDMGIELLDGGVLDSGQLGERLVAIGGGEGRRLQRLEDE